MSIQKTKKQITDDLKGHERPFRNLIESLKTGVYMADSQGRLIYANRSYVQILGYKSKKELFGVNIEKRLYGNPDDRRKFLKRMRQDGFVKDYEVKNKRKDGSEIILSVTSNLIRNDLGHIVGTEGIVRDITEEKRAQEAIRREKDFSQALLDTIPFGMEIVDENGMILFLNNQFKILFGSKAIGKKCWELYKDNKKQCSMCPLLKGIKIGETKTIETAAALGGRSFEITHTGMLYEGRRAILEIFKDVTARKEAERKLKITRETLKTEKQKLEQVLGIDQRISSILEINHLVDFIIEKASDILEAQRCSLMLLDPQTQELIIKGAIGLDEDIIKNTRLKIGEQIAGRVAKEGKPLLVVNIESQKPIARRNRPTYQGKSFISVPIKLHNKIVGVVNISDKDSLKEDVFNHIDLKILSTIVRQAAIAIENANYYKELEYLSSSDSLTGLYNHRYFVKRLDQEIDRSKRYPKALCLMIVDVDDFKSYNDSFGHLEGDHLLKVVAKLLKNSLRSVDIVCRYAGDEFTVILPETDMKGAHRIAEKILAATKSLKLKQSVSLSIGISLCTPKMDRYDLIMKTDQALYQAKKEGKDKICTFS